MAYLRLDQSLDMNAVTISVWFRIPQASAGLVRQLSGDYWDYRVMLGVIPLISWGQQQTVPVTGTVREDTGIVDTSGTPYFIEHTESHSAPQSMSCIGVFVGEGQGPDPNLSVYIQTKDYPTATGLQFIYTSWTSDGYDHTFNDLFNAANPMNGRPVHKNFQLTGKTDVSYMYTDHPDYFGNTGLSGGSGIPAVMLDEWHHLLISWELIGHSNMEGASRMWCAIDDVNKSGSDLPAMCEPVQNMDINDHVAWLPWTNKGNDEVSVSIAITPVPSNPLCLPGPASISYAIDEHGGTASREPIHVVEMAELQIFAGVTLDTGDETARRSFIDFPDEHSIIGDPDDPATRRGMKPVNPKKAEEFMGRRPAVLLHGNTNWQEGRNTGSLGRDVDGNDIPSGQFSHIGRITKYKPEPELGE